MRVTNQFFQLTSLLNLCSLARFRFLAKESQESPSPASTVDLQLYLLDSTAWLLALEEAATSHFLTFQNRIKTKYLKWEMHKQICNAFIAKDQDSMHM